MRTGGHGSRWPGPICLYLCSRVNRTTILLFYQPQAFTSVLIIRTGIYDHSCLVTGWLDHLRSALSCVFPGAFYDCARLFCTAGMDMAHLLHLLEKCFSWRFLRLCSFVLYRWDGYGALATLA